MLDGDTQVQQKSVSNVTIYVEMGFKEELLPLQGKVNHSHIHILTYWLNLHRGQFVWLGYYVFLQTFKSVCVF